MGFIIGEKSYMRNGWNVLDFIIVIISILTWILDRYSNINLGYIKAIRSLRALRPLRALGRNEGKIFIFYI